MRFEWRAILSEVIAQKEPTLDESTVARIVGMAVGTAVELGVPATLAATEGVWTALRFSEFAATKGRAKGARQSEPSRRLLARAGTRRFR